MTQIDTYGMEVAELTEEQLTRLRQAEQAINSGAGNRQEVYLLAVTRK